MDHNIQHSWSYFDPEFETLSDRINPPRVIVDNSTSEKATLIKVDSVDIHGVLLEVVQVLTDLNLSISKAYISSDGGWFMDVFHVTDSHNKKLTDNSVILDIKKSLVEQKCRHRYFGKTPGRTVGVTTVADHTIIELTGADRLGLLSEISEALHKLGCDVKRAEIWTHSLRVACVVSVTDEKTGGTVEDAEKQAQIREKLTVVMNGGRYEKQSKAQFGNLCTNRERRLHQMMFEDGELEKNCGAEGLEKEKTGPDELWRPTIEIGNCKEKNYSVVNIKCADRHKLLFDTVCTLTDMQFAVFHAAINSEDGYAYQEYYIRHTDGRFLDTDDEKLHVRKCLLAAIERRVSNGLRLELCASDKVGLLLKVTSLFSKNNLSVTRADVETRDRKAVNVFYVTDATGKTVDRRVVDIMREEMGTAILKVGEVPHISSEPALGSTGYSTFSWSSLLLAAWNLYLSPSNGARRYSARRGAGVHSTRRRAIL